MKSKRVDLKSEKGVTLVEVLLSVALLAIIALPLLNAAYVSLKNNIMSKEKTEAVAMAERAMEQIKAQGTIGEVSGLVASGVASNNMEAYYSIKKDADGKVDQTTAGAIDAPSPDTTYNYSDEINAANQADFELEVDQANINGENKSVDAILYKLDENIRTQLKCISDIKVLNSDLKLHFYLDGVAYKYYLESQNASNTGIFSLRDTKNGVIRLKVTYKNAIPGSDKLKIYTYCEDCDLCIYEENITKDDSGIAFIPKGNQDFFVLYMDTQNIFDYKTPINGLYKITVSVRKKNSSKIVYEMTSYVKK